jgi:hypothetical protein
MLRNCSRTMNIVLNLNFRFDDTIENIDIRALAIAFISSTGMFSVRL